MEKWVKERISELEDEWREIEDTGETDKNYSPEFRKFLIESQIKQILCTTHL